MLCAANLERLIMLNTNKAKEKIVISLLGLIQGGAEIFPIRLANYFYKCGLDVQLHVLSDKEDKFVAEIIDPSIKIVRYDSAWKFILYLTKEKITVVHTHCNGNQLLVAKCLKFAPWLHIKHIATSHGIYEGIDFETAKQQILTCDPYVTRWTYVADNNYETFHKLGIPKDKCVKIGNSMEIPPNIIPANRNEYDIPQDAKVITVISRAVGKKCWFECVEAVKRARKISGLDIHLILGGQGELYNRLKSQGVPYYVHLIGAVSEPCNLYAASDLGMLLSIRECAPLGLIEMYYTKTPVIATDTGDVSEMMCLPDGGNTGILLALNPDGSVNVSGAVDAIVTMLTDTAYYESCMHASERKSKEFEMGFVAEKYLNVYRGL